MPDAPQTPCLQPGGCPGYAVRNGRCAAHAVQSDHNGRKTAERGYDAVWRRFRVWFVARHPVCEDCGRMPTKEVHHKQKLADHPELRCVESNCLGLCKRCHSIRTKRGE